MAFSISFLLTGTAKNLLNIQNGHPVEEGIPPYCV
jgi:hypothetical protein